MLLFNLDGDGLVSHRVGGWDWQDWGSNIDWQLLDNAWYFLALDTMIKLAQLTGNTADLGEWQYRSNSISANFNRVLWRPDRGEYRSPTHPDSQDTDDRGNALSIVAGLSTEAQRSALMQVLGAHQNASPYMELYVLQALYKLGSSGTAEARMKSRYADQVNDSGYTLWELWDRSGTGNHGWNGGPLFVLSAYGAGVRPTSPGFVKYDVRPQLGGQQTINSVVPTVKGSVRVSVNRASSSHLTLTVTSPTGTTATIGVPRIGMVNPQISANGTVVYTNESVANYVSGLSYVARDLDYVYFTATPGTWSFDETGTDPTWCANENGTCTFSGTKLVRYGANGSYVYRVVNGDVSGSVACNNTTFGDPAWGASKQCHYSTPIPAGGPPGYGLCANENGTCAFVGQGSVAYGAYDSFTVRSFSGSAACNNATFGDPIYGVAKNCYYSPEPIAGSSCATEGEVCSFPGSQMVAYGANGKYRYLYATGSVSCNNTSFGGDPIYGAAKSCYPL